MLKGDRYQQRLLLTITTIIVIIISIAAGLVVNTNPRYIFLAIVAGGILYCFFTHFEYTVLGMLILRSALDPFSTLQIPAAFALGLDALTLIYITLQLLTRQKVHTDRFWWFFAGWVALQSLWVVLLPLGGLGFDASYLLVSIREWTRLFSWLMVYLLVMQLKDRLPPQKVISALFLALIIPVTVGLMQMLVPSLLPGFLVGNQSAGSIMSEEISRVNGTLGLANTFATFLLLFIGLTLWKLSQQEKHWFWLVLLGILILLFVGTKSLFSLMMLGVFVLIWIAPKLSFINLIGGVLLFAVVIGLFASSEFGHDRLGSLSETPLLNPDMDIWQAILLSAGDGNSFNWRLSQWYLLLNAWQHFPVLGYGLGLSIQAAANGFLPHNDYIRALVEGGIVGFLTFLTFLTTQGIYLFQLAQKTPDGSEQRNLCLVLLAILISIPVGMLTENIWSHTTLFFYWWTAFAVVGWNWNDRPSTLSILGGI